MRYREKAERFVGAKRGSGIAEWLITLMPPHTTYVEAFLGTGALFKKKSPVLQSIGIEADPIVIAKFWAKDSLGMNIVQGDALTMLPALKVDRSWLVYADPPYLMSERSCKRTYYGREMHAEEEHKTLLALLCSMDCNVMLSGYASSLYINLLKDWRVSSHGTSNRAGKKVMEFCWMNFSPPERLHDSRFAGDNFTRRQNIKRMCQRWKKRFHRLDSQERSAVLDTLMFAGTDSQEELAGPAVLQEKNETPLLPGVADKPLCSYENTD